MRVLLTMSLLVACGLFDVSAEAQTQVARKSGECHLAEYNRFVDGSHFEIKLALRMHYDLQVSALKVRGDEAASANVFVVNPTDDALYCCSHVAFFDGQGRLVCCTGYNSTKPVAGDGRKRQYACTTAKLQPGILDSIVAYRVVVYESAQFPGVEPVSPELGRTLPGETGPAVLQLADVTSTTEKVGSIRALRGTAEVSFRDAGNERTDMKLPLGKQETLELELSPNLSDGRFTYQSGSKRHEQKVRLWRLNAQLETAKGETTPEGNFYYALLDDAGGLVACGLSIFTARDYLGSNSLPKDQLFSATRIESVLWTPENSASH